MNFTPSQLARFFTALLKELEQIKGAIKEQRTAKDATQGENAEQELPSSIGVVVDFSDAEKHSRDVGDRKKHVQQENLISWTKMACGVVAASTLVTVGGVWQAKRAAEAASSSVIASSRAWISPTGAGLDSPLALGEKLKFSIQYNNPGRSPAFDVHPVYTITPIGVERFDDNTFNPLIESTENCIPLQPAVGADVVYPEQPNGYTLQFRLNDPKWVTEDMVKGNVAIVIRMCFAYRTMGEIHHTSFCYFYRAGITEDFRKLNICTAGNHAD